MTGVQTCALPILGLTDEGFQQINQVYFLYSELYKAYCTAGGALRPSDEEIAAFAQSGGYCTFLPLYWSITGDEATDAATLTQAQEAAARLRSAEDVTAAYLQIAQELALQASETGETAAVQDLDSSVAAVLTALAEGQVSDVVTTANGYYVFVGQALNADAVLDKMFNAKLDAMRESAGIRYNCRSYDKLNVARFYTKLQTLRSQLSSAGTDGNTSAGTDTAPQS